MKLEAVVLEEYVRLTEFPSTCSGVVVIDNQEIPFEGESVTEETGWHIDGTFGNIDDAVYETICWTLDGIEGKGPTILIRGIGRLYLDSYSKKTEQLTGRLVVFDDEAEFEVCCCGETVCPQVGMYEYQDLCEKLSKLREANSGRLSLELVPLSEATTVSD